MRKKKRKKGELKQTGWEILCDDLHSDLVRVQLRFCKPRSEEEMRTFIPGLIRNLTYVLEESNAPQK